MATHRAVNYQFPLGSRACWPKQPHMRTLESDYSPLLRRSSHLLSMARPLSISLGCPMASDATISLPNTATTAMSMPATVVCPRLRSRVWLGLALTWVLRNRECLSLRAGRLDWPSQAWSPRVHFDSLRFAFCKMLCRRSHCSCSWTAVVWHLAWRKDWRQL